MVQIIVRIAAVTVVASAVAAGALAGPAAAQGAGSTRDALVAQKTTKDICSAIKSVIGDRRDSRIVARTAIEMGHNPCRVVRCAVEGGGDLEKVIAGAVEAGTGPDVVARCSIEGGAGADQVASILRMTPLGASLCYFDIEEEPGPIEHAAWDPFPPGDLKQNISPHTF